MKHIKSFFSITVITSLMIMMFLGTVYGSSVTIQREGALQKSQESAVLKNDRAVDGNPLKFEPQRIRDKSDSGRESETSSHSLKRERYKPYQEGEGEIKIK